MRTRFFILSALLAGAVCAARPTRHDALIVHEWGTFLTMNDSEGVTLDGMYHEEHALPEFVHARSKDQLHLPATSVKGETPVIYFYTPQEQNVRVTVRFPQGMWTQWYPQAEMVAPGLTQVDDALEPRRGRITWNARLIPADNKRVAPALPQTEKGALWNFARQVDSAYVRTTDRTKSSGAAETERYLFYRGLGRASMPLRADTSGGGTLSLDTSSDTSVNHLFVLRVEKGKGAFRYLPTLNPGDHKTDVLPKDSEALPLSEFTANVSEAMEKRLIESGLYPKEARGMVNTWKSSYFQSDGVRVLYVLPQAWTEKFIPMEIEPRPEKLVRVMVGRTELLTPEREKGIESAILHLGSPQSDVRQAAFDTLRKQGRYIEPILRRTLRTSEDRQVQALCKRLLLTDFVRELRSAVNDSATGEKRAEEPVHVRAQLSNLLREAGLVTEAKAEGGRALSELAKGPRPVLTEDSARHFLRSQARALEGVGEKGKAAAAYARFVEFGSQVQNGCAGCHSNVLAPRTMDWFRDWYAGRKFAEYTEQLGRTDSAIARYREQLAAHPNDTASKMLLAYLYAQNGKRKEADALWTQISGRRAVASSR